MFKKKKAQGISINTIIIAAIAIVVLIVLVLIFTGQIDLFAKQVTACTGTCVESAADCTGPYEKIVISAKGACPDEANPVCCITVKTT